MSVVIEREMTISRSEFLRLLPLAVLPGTRIEIDLVDINIEEPDQVIRITAQERAEVIIASLCLPNLHVRIELEAMAMSDFMQRFDRAFQRGGG